MNAEFDYDLPEGYEDAVYTNVDILFGWKDRIKIMFGYLVSVKTQTICQLKPGNARSETIVKVWKPRNHGIAYVAVQETEND